MPTDPRQAGERAGRGRALTRVRRGTRFLGVPVSAIVVVELVVAAVLTGGEVSIAQEAAVLAAALVIAVLALVPVRGMRLSTWVFSAVSFGARRHRVSTPTGATDVEPAPPVRRSSGDQRDGEPDAAPVPVPPDVQAFFPGLMALRSASRSGAEIGLVQWQGRWLAVMEVEAANADVLSSREPPTVPVDRFLRALAGRDFCLDAMSVVTQSLYGSTARFGRGSLSQVADELAGVAPLVRSRRTWITLRVDPVQASSAIAARGGGFTGLGRLFAAGLARVESEAGRAGLVGRPLAADAVLRTMSLALLEPSSRTTGPVQWSESWKSVSSQAAHHRCFAVSSWHERPLDRISLNTSFAVTVAHEVRNVDDDEPAVSSVLRLTAADHDQLEQGARQLRARCNAAGVTIRVVRGRQVTALRMTVPAGQR